MRSQWTTLLLAAALLATLSLTETSALRPAAVSRPSLRSLQGTETAANTTLVVDDDHYHYEGDGHDHDVAFGTTQSSEEQQASNKDKPWGEAIGAALLVNTATLVGLLFLLPTLVAGFCCRSRAHNEPTERALARHRCFVYNIIPSFACGALLATAVFLIIPESIMLIGTASGAVEEHHHEGRALREHNPESIMAWKFGISFLGGFLLPLVLGALFPHPHVPLPEECPVCDEREEEELRKAEDVTKDVELWDNCVQNITTPAHVHGVTTAVELGGDDNSVEVGTTPSCVDEGCTEHNHHDEVPVKGQTPPRVINYRLIAAILLGDGFHNFCDGIFMGTAFLLCSRSVAFGIVFATIFHELAQELADYFLLTTHSGLTPLVALTLNFVSGLSVLLGVIVILALDVSALTTGCILAMSAGVYVNIAASECLPRIEKEVKHIKDRLLSLLCFTVGAVPIGLVLLNHGHCEA